MLGADPQYWDSGVEIVEPWIPNIADPVPDWAKDALEKTPDSTTPQSEQRSALVQDRISFVELENYGEGPRWYPMASFQVSRGEIGFLYQIETQINGIDGDATRIWYRENDPYSFIHEVPSMVYNGAPLWRLILENRDPYRNATPARFLQIDPGPLPVHPQLGTWGDGRFAPHHGNYRTKLMVPEGTTARLWLCLPIPRLPEVSMPSYASARLVGFTQSWSNNPAARDNARRAF
jgi:hypothetical protein